MIVSDLTGERSYLVVEALRRRTTQRWVDKLNAWFWRALGA